MSKQYTHVRGLLRDAGEIIDNDEEWEKFSHTQKRFIIWQVQRIDISICNWVQEKLLKESKQEQI